MIGDPSQLSDRDDERVDKIHDSAVHFQENHIHDSMAHRSFIPNFGHCITSISSPWTGLTGVEEECSTSVAGVMKGKRPKVLGGDTSRSKMGLELGWWCPLGCHCMELAVAGWLSFLPSIILKRQRTPS